MSPDAMFEELEARTQQALAAASRATLAVRKADFRLRILGSILLLRIHLMRGLGILTPENFAKLSSDQGREYVEDLSRLHGALRKVIELLHQTLLPLPSISRRLVDDIHVLTERLGDRLESFSLALNSAFLRFVRDAVDRLESKQAYPTVGGAEALPQFNKRVWKCRAKSWDPRKGRSRSYRIIVYHNADRNVLYPILVYRKSEGEGDSPQEMQEVVGELHQALAEQ